MEEVQRRAQRCGLPPIRWPDPWPGDGLLAMRAVTFAFTRGDDDGRELALAAFRAAFRNGIDLSVEAEVLATASRAGLRQEDVRQAVRDPQIKQALRDATQAAHVAGVFGVPTVAVDGELFWGDDRLQEAAARARELSADATDEPPADATCGSARSTDEPPAGPTSEPPRRG